MKSLTVKQPWASLIIRGAITKLKRKGGKK